MEKCETQPHGPIKLSVVQARMLLFFAGQRDDPCGHTSTTRSLITRELLAWDAQSDRYQITKLGRQVAARLNLAAADIAG
jgi:hypothetical protein